MPITYKAWRYLHYNIKISIIQVPPDVYSVTYVLDESYKDRVIEVIRGVSNFTEDISSYGDFTITAIVKGTLTNLVIESKLSEALRKFYQIDNSNMSDAVKDALDKIEENG